MNIQNVDPAAASGEPRNGAKPLPAKVPGAKANVAKMTPAKKAASAEVADAATPAAAQEPHEIVLDLMFGGVDSDRLDELPAEVQALLVTVMLEQRRPDLFDERGIYVGTDNFTATISQMLGGPPGGRVITVMRYMRRDGAYTSRGTGVRAEITFTGTDQARTIVSDVNERRRAKADESLIGPTPGSAPTPDDTGAYAPRMGRRLSLSSLPPFPVPPIGRSSNSELKALLVNAVAEDAWRQLGYDPNLVDLLTVELQSRRRA